MFRSTEVSPASVVDYDPCWPVIFQSLRKRVSRALGGMFVAIEHVGSTAVPNLAAKPIIDIDVLLKSADMIPAAMERLASLGYVFHGNPGVSECEVFLAPSADPPHRISVCPPRSAEFRRHIAFRNFLRAHRQEAQIYGNLRIAPGERLLEERSAHVTAESEFVSKATRRAGSDAQEAF